MEEEGGAERPLGARAADLFDRMEAVYLRILRGFILIFATLLILYAAGLAVVSLYKMSRSPSSIIEQEATVSGGDLLAAEGLEMARPGERGEQDRTNPAHRQFYQQFVRRYHALFRQRFEPFRRRGDRQLALDAFDDAYVNSDVRLEATAEAGGNFAADRADLELLLRAMAEAAQTPETQRRLQAYKNAREVRVCRDVQRTRAVQRSGWDRYSTSCSDWYYPPYGCPVTRSVRQPYTQRVCEMRLPEGTRSHADVFRAYHDRFFALLGQRRRENSENAAAARLAIEYGRVEGSMSLSKAAYVFGGFLLVMFFFLLIAIERHQRRLARALAPATDGGPVEQPAPEPNPIAT
ncbi:MAG TPA: hypothetical protein VGB08_00720 [Allosphingosinicella sp.]|jgi:hypothetical protein